MKSSRRNDPGALWTWTRALAVSTALMVAVPSAAAASPAGTVRARAAAGPATPALVGAVASSSSLSGVTAVAVAGHYAYTTAYDAGQLTAVDISNPSAPVVAGSSPENTALLNADTVAISGGYAYVVSKNRNASTKSNDDGTGNALTILDIHSDPAHPAIVGSVHDAKTLFGAYGVAVVGNYAYVAAQGCVSGQPCPDHTVGNDFDVIDISDPTAPRILATVANPASGQSFANALLHADAVAVSGSYAYVTASYSDTLAVLDISTPQSPRLVGALTDQQYLPLADDVAIQNGYAYVADETQPNGHMAVIDLANPLAPTVSAVVTDPALGGAYRIRVRGQYAYVAGDQGEAIAMVDITSATQPKLAASVVDDSHLNHTTGLDLTTSGRYLVATSPFLSSEHPSPYPPFPGQPGGPTATGTVSVLDMDPAGVAVGITSPTAGAVYKNGELVKAAYTCTPGGLLALATCTGPAAAGAPIDTTTPGTHTFTVTGIDQDGQTGTATVTYRVLAPLVSITTLRESARRWREPSRKRPRGGTRFTIGVSQPARLTLSFLRIVPGRRVGGRCVALGRTGARSRRHVARCWRTVVSGRLRMSVGAGVKTVAFRGRISGRSLPAGSYRLAVTATAAGSQVTRTIAFTILR